MFSYMNSKTRLILILITAAMLCSSISEAGVFGDKQKKQAKRQQKADQIMAQNYVPGDGWEAYFRDDKGRTYPIVQPIEQNKDKDWLGLVFTEFSGPVIRLAVMRVENKTAHVDQAAGTGSYLYTSRIAEVPIGSIEELLTTAIYNTHRFELIERKALDAVFGEQDLGDSGRVTEQTKAKIGQNLGADYLILTAVNEWAGQKKKMGGGAGAVLGGALGMIRGGKSTAEVAMSFRVVDSKTGKVLFSTTERAEAGSWGVGLGGFGGSAGALGGYSKNSPVNYAVHSCINMGVYQLAMWLKDRAWSGSVVKVAGQKVYVNAGSDKGITSGMTLTALAKGEELIDPDTGISLGADTEVIGSMLVTTVKESYSIATIVQGCNGLQKGDRVELESSAYSPPAEGG